MVMKASCSQPTSKGEADVGGGVGQGPAIDTCKYRAEQHRNMSTYVYKCVHIAAGLKLSPWTTARVAMFGTGRCCLYDLLPQV
jgi:hypothetical protein